MKRTATPKNVQAKRSFALSLKLMYNTVGQREPCTGRNPLPLSGPRAPRTGQTGSAFYRRWMLAPLALITLAAPVPYDGEREPTSNGCEITGWDGLAPLPSVVIQWVQNRPPKVAYKSSEQTRCI